jgi:hypothetical protein
MDKSFDTYYGRALPSLLVLVLQANFHTHTPPNVTMCGLA